MQWMNEFDSTLLDGQVTLTGNGEYSGGWIEFWACRRLFLRLEVGFFLENGVLPVQRAIGREVNRVGDGLVRLAPV